MSDLLQFTNKVLAERWCLLAPISRTEEVVWYLATDRTTRGRAMVRLVLDGDVVALPQGPLPAAAQRGIVPVLAAGLFEDILGDVAYAVTPFLEGETLRERLTRRVAAMSPRECLQVVRQLLQTLVGVHECGLVHGAVTPENTLRLASHHPEAALAPTRLFDFGTVRLRGNPGYADHPYAAPEATSSPADPRADVYSVGVILFELLTQRGPALPDESAAPGLATLIDARDLADVHFTSTATEPADRYPSAREMLDALHSLRPLRRGRLPSHSPFSSRSLEDSVEALPFDSDSESGLITFDDATVRSLEEDARTPVAVDPVRFDQPAISAHKNRTRPVPLVQGSVPKKSSDTGASVDGMVLPSLPKRDK